MDGPEQEDRLEHPAGRGLVTCSSDSKEGVSEGGGRPLEGKSKEPIEYVSFCIRRK